MFEYKILYLSEFTDIQREISTFAGMGWILVGPVIPIYIGTKYPDFTATMQKKMYS